MDGGARFRLHARRIGLAVSLVLALSSTLKTGCDVPVETPVASGPSASPAGTAKPTGKAPVKPSTKPSAKPSAKPGPTVKPVTGKAAEVLAKLPVKGRAPKTGYDRDQFGPAWADVDRNGCDTRNDVLHRQLQGATFKANTRNCVVLTGTLSDPYTHTLIAFRRGEQTSDAVQIDHVVAESDAWQKGAQRLDAARRQQFANDPMNLIAVDGPTNQSKGDSDAATWLPPNKAYRCAYVARQIVVKATYGLWVTPAERAAMLGVLQGCPGQGVPTGPAGPRG